VKHPVYTYTQKTGALFLNNIGGFL
jgi:hypothetical protein